MMALLLIIAAFLISWGSPPPQAIPVEEPEIMELEISPEDLRGLQELIDFLEGPMIEIA